MKRLGEAAVALDDERWVKTRLASVPAPQPSPDLLAALERIGQPAAHRSLPAGSLRPRGRADGTGPGRAVTTERSRPAGPGPSRRARNRCLAAAGLAASVMVGLGSGGLGTGAVSGGGVASGGVANQPAPPRPSSAIETVSVAGAVTAPVQVRSLVRPSSRTVLSVVYRRP